MPTPLNPKITEAGRALFPSPLTAGFQVSLTHVAFGTGLYEPDGTEVALVNEKVRFPLGSGTSPTPTSVQVGLTFSDFDPAGRTANGESIGEIGFFAGTTLFAVWSRPTTPLLVKSAAFDVPIAYTFDTSVLPQSSVTVLINNSGNSAFVLAHEAYSDPHPQYTTVPEVQALLTAAEYPSMVAYFAKSSAPPGWLKANGAAVSRTTYARLFGEIGTVFGAGNGTTTFNVPDLRAHVIRGLDDGRGIDVGRVLGSVQLGQNASHTHGITDPGHNHVLTDPGHNHAITDTGHNHSVNDPEHAHNIYDPGHGHSIHDPGHGHTIETNGVANGDRSYYPMGGSEYQSPTNVRTLNDYTGISIYAATANVGIYGAATGISVIAKATGITVNNKVTGITVVSKVTGVTVQADGGSEVRVLNTALLACIKY